MPSKNGNIRGARVVDSSRGGFGTAALDAIRKSPWRPGEHGDEAVNTRVRKKFHFKL